MPERLAMLSSSNGLRFTRADRTLRNPLACMLHGLTLSIKLAAGSKQLRGGWILQNRHGSWR